MPVGVGAGVDRLPARRPRRDGHPPAPVLEPVRARAEAGTGEDASHPAADPAADPGAGAGRGGDPGLDAAQHPGGGVAQRQRQRRAGERDALAKRERRERLAPLSGIEQGTAVDHGRIDERRGRHRRKHRAALAAPRSQPDRAAGADGVRGALILDQQGRVAEPRRVGVAGHLGHALERPAGYHVRGARHPARHPGHGDLEIDLGELLAVALAGGVGGEPDGEVGRQRLEAAGLNDLHPGALGGGAVAVEHPPGERDLPGEVDVVGAAVDTGGDHRLAIEGVGADEVDDHPRALRHLPERARLADVGGDRHRRLDAHLGEDALELVGVSRGGGPAGATRGHALAEVRGDAPAGDAGRAEDDDVDLTLGHPARP